jgi:hypothetical protein
MTARPAARIPIPVAFLGFLFFTSVGSLVRVLDRPSLATIRTVDVVHLTGAAACFGASITGLIGYACFRHYMRVSQPADSCELMSGSEAHPK